MKDLLPVGSVVLLKNATKKLMIIGIMQYSEKGSKLHDYLGVPYPEGYIGDGHNFLFSHEDINDVIFRGYSSPEREGFMEMMKLLYEREQKKEQMG